MVIVSIWWKRTLATCVAVATLASCTGTTGKPKVGAPSTTTLTPDRKPDDSLILGQLGGDDVSCRYGIVVQLKLNGSKEGPGGNIIEVSQESDHTRIEWNGETTHALIVNDMSWVFVTDPEVTLLYDKHWGPIKKLVLCPREHQ